MLHPSYTELISAVNKNAAEGEEPVVNSRYSIVIATAKRARQLVAGEEAMVEADEKKKPLSIAVEELYDGKVKILPEGEAEETDEEALEEDWTEDSFDGEADEEGANEEDINEEDTNEEDAGEFVTEEEPQEEDAQE